MMLVLRSITSRARFLIRDVAYIDLPPLLATTAMNRQDYEARMPCSENITEAGVSHDYLVGSKASIARWPMIMCLRHSHAVRIQYTATYKAERQVIDHLLTI